MGVKSTSPLVTDPESDINVSSNFTKHKVIMVVGRADYNWTATISTDMAREYARQLIAAADAVDKAQPEQKTVPKFGNAKIGESEEAK